MNKGTINARELLIENNIEMQFKKYLDKIKNVFGEDYAALILTCDKDINKSLNQFSSKFRHLGTANIESLLFQSAILSEKNIYNDIFNKRTNEDFWFELFLTMERDMLLKKAFIREFIKDCDKSNIELFNKLKSHEEKEKAIHNIYQLKNFVKLLSYQESYKKSDHMKELKKGNY